MKVQAAQRSFAQWLETTRDLSPHTVRAYSADVQVLCRHVGANMPVETISSQLLTKFLEEQRSTGLSPATLRPRIAALRAFCRWLVASGALNGSDHLNADPWSGVTIRVRKPRSLPRAVPASELGRLLSHLQSAASIPRGRHAPRLLSRPHESTTLLAVGLMISTGLRVSEIVGIRYSDIDVDDARICVKAKSISPG